MLAAAAGESLTNTADVVTGVERPGRHQRPGLGRALGGGTQEPPPPGTPNPHRRRGHRPLPDVPRLGWPARGDIIPQSTLGLSLLLAGLLLTWAAAPPGELVPVRRSVRAPTPGGPDSRRRPGLT